MDENIIYSAEVKKQTKKKHKLNINDSVFEESLIISE